MAILNIRKCIIDTCDKFAVSVRQKLTSNEIGALYEIVAYFEDGREIVIDTVEYDAISQSLSDINVIINNNRGDC